MDAEEPKNVEVSMNTEVLRNMWTTKDKEDKMKKEQIKKIYDSKYMKLYDIQYEKGAHYYCASRREEDRIPVLMPKEAYQTLLPDAVSCVVVLNIKGEESKLLLSWEYRYPAGQYLLSVPAGIIDPEDWKSPNALERTAVRELHEETGIVVGPTDEVKVINPFVFSTPGMTDEANGLVFISINRDTMPELTQSGAEGSEQFDGFRILSKKDAQEYLRRGRDEHGIYYPLYTWAALMYFVNLV
ncbi:MAG: NUDIX hydrolase [Clostridiales bacterium]|nr:NUDIX hydrolase [Clostridiales bacterium]